MVKQHRRISLCVSVMLMFSLCFGMVLPGTGLGTTLAAAAEWGDPTEPIELIVNGGFEDGLAEWGYYVHGDPATIEATTIASDEGPLGGSRSFHASIVNGGNEYWHVQLNQPVPADKGLQYTLSFKAKAAADRPIQVDLQENGGAYTRYWEHIFDITTEVDTYTLTFTPSDTDLGAVFNFFVGNNNNSVWLDDISLTVNGAPTDGKTLHETGFEEGTASGWSGAGETVTVSVDEDAGIAHGGNRFLHVEGREQNWQGAMYDLIGRAEEGTTYLFSAWVRLAEAPAESETIVVTLTRNTSDDWQQASYEQVATSGVSSTEWTRLEGEIVVPALPAGEVFKALNVKLDSTGGTFDYYVDDVSIVKKPPVLIDFTIPSMWEVYEDVFPIGASVEPRDLVVDGSRDLLAKHYNSLTLENSMKASAIHPEEERYDFTAGDAVASYTLESGKKLRGHALVWHASTPAWMFRDGDGNPLDPSNPDHVQLVDDRLKAHIHEVVTHYEEMDHAVYAWDVVNEAIDESQANGFRRSQWYEFMGPDYIAKSFHYAYEADMEDGTKDIQLYYNDYNEYDPMKRSFILALLNDLIEDEVPIDGFGMQMHIGLSSPSISSIAASIDLYAATGLDVQATELDVNIYDTYVTPMDVLTPEASVALGYRYKDLFELFREKAGEGKFDAVTFWNHYDARSWLNVYVSPENKSHPLPFDRQFQAKQAYWGIVDPSKLDLLIKEARAVHGTPNAADRVEDDVFRYLAPVSITGGVPASYSAAWDNDNLYVFVRVNDSTVDAGDKVEVFIDPDLSRSEVGRDSEDVHLTLQPVARTAGGYVVETAIPFPAADWQKGDVIGLDIRITDGDSSFSWNDPLQEQEQHTAGYGNVTLAEIPYAEVVEAGTLPVIDGTKESAWNDALQLETNTVVRNTPGTTAATGTFHVMWKENKLYVLAEVTDSVLNKDNGATHEQDSIEVFLDENNAKTPDYEDQGDAQFRVNYDNLLSFNGKTPYTDVESATTLTDTGYIVEIVIPFLTIEQAEAGRLIGFDVQVNDADASGSRKNAVTWAAVGDMGWRSTLEYGVVKLAAKPQPPVSGGSGTITIETQPVKTQVSGNKATTVVSRDGVGKLLGVHSDKVAIDAVAVAEEKDKVAEQSIELPASLLLGAAKAGKSIVITHSNGTIVIPAGAIELAAGDDGATVELKVQRRAFSSSSDLEGALPAHVQRPSSAYEFSLTVGGADRDSFLKPLDVTLPIDAANNSSVFYWNEAAGQWQYVGGETGDGGITFHTDHFSVYAALGVRVAFGDIATHWAKMDMEWLAARLIVNGKSAASFAPEDKVTRAEFAAMLTRALLLDRTSDEGVAFADVEADAWYAPYVGAVVQDGLMEGMSDGTFQPDKIMTREEMAVVLMRAYNRVVGADSDVSASAGSLSFTDTAAIASWAVDSVGEAVAAGLLQGMPDGSFQPQGALSRAQAATVLAALLQEQ